MGTNTRPLNNINRREFLGFCSAGVAAAAGGAFKPLLRHMQMAQLPKMEVRQLGRTGLKVSSIGFGAMTTSEAGVIRRGVELGINYVDTADCYMGGRNEEIVGEALLGLRDKVVLATKVHISSVDAMTASVERSLKRLKTDRVDVMLLHGLESKEQVNNDTALEALAKVKKSGKVRFCGVSTHKNIAEVLDSASENGFYDVVLCAYNFQSPLEIKDAVQRAASRNVGIIAMKTQAGGYAGAVSAGISPHQAALRWVLSDNNVSTTIPSMVNLAQVDENIRSLEHGLTMQDEAVLMAYGASISGVYCSMCSSCSGACPKNVDVQGVNRVLMYRDGYRQEALARTGYGEIAESKRPVACASCDSCAVKCANGLDIRERMRYASRVFDA